MGIFEGFFLAILEQLLFGLFEALFGGLFI
jgi:hypothetical protein